MSAPALPWIRIFLSKQADRVWVPDGLGALLVTVHDGEDGVLHASQGADPDGKAPLPSDTFRVGSITKVFTSVVVLMLADEGLVDLDAPVGDYVSRVDVPPEVVVRDLLGHTSGIANYTDVPGFFDTIQEDTGRVWLPEEMVELVAGEQPLFEPGSDFSYSNTNYIILGILIEEVTERPYHEVVRARILEPLAMSSTYVAGVEDGPDPFGAYTSIEGPVAAIDFDYTSIATSAWSAGAMVSSPQDLHLLLTALFDGQIISDESLAQMTAGEEYGLGIAVWESPAGIFGHNGGIPGYSTLVVHAPETGSTAFWVATGEFDFGPAVDRIVERISADSGD